jgi:hypothetical protein
MKTTTNCTKSKWWLSLVGALALLLVTLFPIVISAQTGPDTMNYQGWLLDASGEPRGGETHCMRFRICSDGACSNQRWPGSGYEYHTVATESGVNKGGLFNVTLGSVNPIPPTLTYDYDALYLEIGVSDAGSGCQAAAYTTLLPRSQLQTNAYAQRSRRVRTEESDDAYLINIRNTGSGGGISARTDSTSDGAQAGSFTAAGSSGRSWAVYARNLSTSDNARVGDFWASGTSGGTYGVYVENNSAGDTATTGFFWANADSGSTKAVWALNDSSGDNSRAGSFRSRGTSGETYGVHTDVDSPDGIALYATAPTTAVVGIAGNTSRVTRGVYGRVDSSADGAAAGYFHSDRASGVTYGVYARNDSPAGYAGYFDGDVHVNGTLSKSAGLFKIDHPLDPANRYLMHSFVESPDMKNVYDGVVQLDQDGEAWVQLPDYFQALNRDFCYQLTPIGGPAPGLYIASEIEDNRFQIAGGEPGLKVSWQVTGIRQDAYAEAYPIPVEPMKPEGERGTYLHPELYAEGAQP